MNETIKLVIKYKETNDEFLFEEIVNIFKPLIIVYCNKVKKSLDSSFYLYLDDDIKQELLITLYNSINKFNIYPYLDDTNVLKIDQLKESKYFNKFANKYENVINKNKLISEYNLFCNENQFKKYLVKAFNNVISKYFNKLNRTIKIVSLNTMIGDDIELIDTIIDEKPSKPKEYDFSLLSKKDIDFLNKFIEGNRILKNEEVSKKLNVTKQAISKRKIAIIKKFKKKLTF